MIELIVIAIIDNVNVSHSNNDNNGSISITSNSGSTSVSSNSFLSILLHMNLDESFCLWINGLKEEESHGLDRTNWLLHLSNLELYGIGTMEHPFIIAYLFKRIHP